MWQRHSVLSSPSHHTIRDTCTQLLPLVEMYCKYELQEDCSDLRALMLRFDSENELESHELGRSLLFMVRSDGNDLHGHPRIVPQSERPNPFNALRERLQSAALAIQELHPQVCLLPNTSTSTTISTLMAGLANLRHACPRCHSIRHNTLGTKAQTPLMSTFMPTLEHTTKMHCLLKIHLKAL